MNNTNLMVIRNTNHRSYAQVETTILNDPKISWGAKGLFSYMTSKAQSKKEWHLNSNDMYKKAKNGRDSLRSLQKELVQNGYLRVEKKQDEHGIYYIEYTLFEIPQNHPLTGNPEVGFPEVDNQGLYIYKKEIDNKNISISSDADASGEISGEEKALEKKAQKVLLYLKKITGKDYKSYVSNKPTANLKLIKARLREYTYSDCIEVVKYKCTDWWNTSYRKYIRPSTLFNKNHFDDYVQDVKSVQKNPVVLTLDNWRPLHTNTHAEGTYLGFSFDEVKADLSFMQMDIDYMYESDTAVASTFAQLEQFLAAARFQGITMPEIGKYLNLWRSEKNKPSVQEYIKTFKDMKG